MNQSILQVKSVFCQMLLWAAVFCCVVYGAGSGHLIAGFLTGAMASAVYFLLMVYRVNRTMEAPPAKAVRYMQIGWLIRLFFIALVLFLTLKLAPQSIWAAVAGLFLLHYVMAFRALRFAISRRRRSA